METKKIYPFLHVIDTCYDINGHTAFMSCFIDLPDRFFLHEILTTLDGVPIDLFYPNHRIFSYFARKYSIKHTFSFYRSHQTRYCTLTLTNIRHTVVNEPFSFYL